MLRIILFSTLILGITVTGCATTQNVISKVSTSDTPLEQVLKLRPELRKEMATVELRQFFNNVESPTAGQVKVTETGLMDDSVKAIQTIYHFKLDGRQWELVNTQKAYQCLRGSNTKKYQKEPCP
ncbi:hypothetical protein [Acinetobacter pseudolwoffii]|uniref:hypothetical protein n=1 Tax=Acinetobacter pseudolwoffii TaxID=2053287 RepID=UPI002468AA19|nr:hypothetical protein [Acinetobacter pseudolwoffii]MDH5820176.1 hypothetical protein [Acinetobacter pseudolwoffii]